MTDKAARFRIRFAGEPRGLWRETFQHAMDDAIAAGLTSYDASRREYFMSAPVNIEREEIKR